MKRLLLFLMVMIAVLAFGTAAHADAFDGGTFLVTANVVPTCVVTTAPILFGQYGGVPVNANGSVTVNCITGVFYEIALDIGENGPLSRQMEGEPGNFLVYDIFQQENSSITWGDKCLPSPSYGGFDCLDDSGSPFVATGVDVEHTTYGRISGSQTSVPVGDYSDTVAVTIWY